MDPANPIVCFSYSAARKSSPRGATGENRSLEERGKGEATRLPFDASRSLRQQTLTVLRCASAVSREDRSSSSKSFAAGVEREIQEGSSTFFSLGWRDPFSTDSPRPLGPCRSRRKVPLLQGSIEYFFALSADESGEKLAGDP